MTGPRKPREPRPRKARIVSGPRIPSSALTSSDRGEFIYDAAKGRIGCVIGLADGSFAGWTLKMKLGRFATAIAAERAVHKAARAKRASKAKAWELRS